MHSARRQSNDAADPIEDLVLRLYVSGMTSRSAEAIGLIKSVCDEFFPGRYDLRVFDLYSQPSEARADSVSAAPTLVKAWPRPATRMIGGFDDRNGLLRSLGVVPPGVQP